MGWLKKLVESRFEAGLPVAADPCRYIRDHRQRGGTLRKSYYQTLEKAAKKHEAIRIMGPRGGMWTAIYVRERDLPNHTETIQMRYLATIVAQMGLQLHWGDWNGKLAYPMSPIRVRTWRGIPFLCIRPRERRWYDPPRMYLVK